MSRAWRVLVLLPVQDAVHRHTDELGDVFQVLTAPQASGAHVITQSLDFLGIAGWHT